MGIMEGGRQGEDHMSERDYQAKAEALRRLSEAEGDQELHAALERMRVDHPHLWGVLHRLHFADDADPSKLEQWRRAPEGSQEDIWGEVSPSASLPDSRRIRGPKRLGHAKE